MPGFDAIQEAFFFYLRVMIGVGGGLLGWLAAGPVVSLLARVAFHRGPPKWAMPWFRLLGAVIVGLLVFWLVDIGGLGGGGGGSGGGTGPGQGPGKNGIGTAKSGATGATGITGKAAVKPMIESVKGPLEIEVLGPTTVKGDKGYVLGRKDAMNWDEIKAFVTANKNEISSLTIVLTKTSVTEFHAPVQRLAALARELEIPHLIKQE